MTRQNVYNFPAVLAMDMEQKTENLRKLSMRRICYSAVIIGVALSVGNCQRFQKLDRKVKRLDRSS